MRLPTRDDLDNLPHTPAEPDVFTRDELAALIPKLETLLASGHLVPLLVVDPETTEILGGGTFRHLDPTGAVVEIGYWLYPRARGRGVATKAARALAEHAFDLGIQRVVACVKLGNGASERVLQRAKFTREGIARSVPTAGGDRVDKAVWSLLPGE